MRFKDFRSSLAVFALVAVVGAVSCAHVLPVASCAEPLVIQVVQNDLSGPDWESKVVSDVGKYGVSVVDCIVNEIITQATAAEKAGKVGTTPMVDHARAYKAKRDAQSAARYDRVNIQAASVCQSGGIVVGLNSGQINALSETFEPSMMFEPSLMWEPAVVDTVTVDGSLLASTGLVMCEASVDGTCVALSGDVTPSGK